MSVSRYYKEPDGQDIFGKMYYVLSRTAIATGAFALVDISLYSRPKGAVKTLGRLAELSWPAFGMASTFVATTYVMTNLRKKDDPWNYIIAGYAAGSIFGTYWRKPSVGFVAGTVIAIMAGVKKYGVMNGFTFFPNVMVEHNTVSTRHRDYSLTSEIPGNWVRAEQVK